MNLESPDNKKSFYPNQTLDQDDDNWQVTYLDIFTILLGFLFILLSFSKINQIDLTSVSTLFKSSTKESRFITTPIEEIKKELNQQLQKEISQGKLEIVRDLNDLRIRFSSDELYPSGSVNLQPSAFQLLESVLNAIKKIPYNDFNIDVEGHTDDTPITSKAYPSNWELSTGRASKIVKYFAQHGIENTRLKASGYGDSSPRVPNEDARGNPIPKNKDLNRRIVLRLYYATAKTEKNARESLYSTP